jgi:hypothetical protein
VKYIFNEHLEDAARKRERLVCCQGLRMQRAKLPRDSFAPPNETMTQIMTGQGRLRSISKEVLLTPAPVQLRSGSKPSKAIQSRRD